MQSASTLVRVGSYIVGISVALIPFVLPGTLILKCAAGSVIFVASSFVVLVTGVLRAPAPVPSATSCHLKNLGPPSCSPLVAPLLNIVKFRPLVLTLGFGPKNGGKGGKLLLLLPHPLTCHLPYPLWYLSHPRPWYLLHPHWHVLPLPWQVMHYSCHLHSPSHLLHLPGHLHQPWHNHALSHAGMALALIFVALILVVMPNLLQFWHSWLLEGHQNLFVGPLLLGAQPSLVCLPLHLHMHLPSHLFVARLAIAVYASSLLHLLLATLSSSAFGQPGPISRLTMSANLFCLLVHLHPPHIVAAAPMHQSIPLGLCVLGLSSQCGRPFIQTSPRRTGTLLCALLAINTKIVTLLTARLLLLRHWLCLLLHRLLLPMILGSTQSSHHSSPPPVPSLPLCTRPGPRTLTTPGQFLHLHLHLPLLTMSPSQSPSQGTWHFHQLLMLLPSQLLLHLHLPWSHLLLLLSSCFFCSPLLLPQALLSCIWPPVLMALLLSSETLLCTLVLFFSHSLQGCQVSFVL